MAYEHWKQAVIEYNGKRMAEEIFRHVPDQETLDRNFERIKELGYKVAAYYEKYNPCHERYFVENEFITRNEFAEYWKLCDLTF